MSAPHDPGVSGNDVARPYHARWLGLRKIDRTRLLELLHANPDATLAELRYLLGIACSEWVIGKILKQLIYTLKKDDPCSGTGSP